MGKKKRSRKHSPPRRPTIARRDEPAPEESGLEQELMVQLKRAMYDDHPQVLLATVSSLVAALEPAGSPAIDSDQPGVSIGELVDSFIDFDVAPTTAALHVLAHLLEEDEIAVRIRRALMRRSQPMPGWIRDLPATGVEGVAVMDDPLGGGANHLLGVRVGGAEPLTMVVYVDHDLGHVVKDAFPVGETLDVVVEKFHSLDEEVTIRTPEAATTRATVQDAIAVGRMTHPPYETDSWPMARPLLEWLLRLLPEGGVGATGREWSEQELDRLAAEFLDSQPGAELDEDQRGLLEPLLWLATSYGSGDPFLWSPVRIEITLLDLVPRKIMAPSGDLEAFPDLLRAFIRYGHHRRGVAPHHSAETLDALEELRDDFTEAIRPGAGVGLGDYFQYLASRTSPEALVGGPEALAELDDAPLRDEEFGWAGIPDDLTEKVRAILDLCDTNADEFLDGEHRTANRRLLRKLVLADPGYFRGRAAARTHAAAVCWMVGHANDSIGPHTDLTVGELLAPFGVRSASQRGGKFREILGLPPHEPYFGPMSLGDPRLLVGVRRGEILDRVELREEHPVVGAPY